VTRVVLDYTLLQKRRILRRPDPARSIVDSLRERSKQIFGIPWVESSAFVLGLADENVFSETRL
jgi:hypothetical protein